MSLLFVINSQLVLSRLSILLCSGRPCGPMDKAPDFESGDSRFESWQGRELALFFSPQESHTHWALEYIPLFLLFLLTSSDTYAEAVHENISDQSTFDVPHYHAHYSTPVDHGTTHISVLAPDGQAVSVTS